MPFESSESPTLNIAPGRSFYDILQTPCNSLRSCNDPAKSDTIGTESGEGNSNMSRPIALSRIVCDPNIFFRRLVPKKVDWWASTPGHSFYIRGAPGVLARFVDFHDRSGSESGFLERCFGADGKRGGPRMNASR